MMNDWTSYTEGDIYCESPHCSVRVSKFDAFQLFWGPSHPVLMIFRSNL